MAKNIILIFFSLFNGFDLITIYVQVTLYDLTKAAKRVLANMTLNYTWVHDTGMCFVVSCLMLMATCL